MEAHYHVSIVLWFTVERQDVFIHSSLTVLGYLEVTPLGKTLPTRSALIRLLPCECAGDAGDDTAV